MKFRIYKQENPEKTLEDGLDVGKIKEIQVRLGYREENSDDDVDLSEFENLDEREDFDSKISNTGKKRRKRVNKSKKASKRY